MRIEQQPAYILHTRSYQETSLLLECLTCDYGRLGVVARGVRSERGRWPRGHLEPFQPLMMNLTLRGELATLRGVDLPQAGLPKVRSGLYGEAVLAGLYLNELLVRLTGRQDAMPSLFAVYACTLERLASNEHVAWTLRRGERDVLDALGYALQLDQEAGSGKPLIPEGRYRYRVEQGPVRVLNDTPRSMRGADLLDLAADRRPDAAGLLALRNMAREVIRFHLGGSELRAWRILSGTLNPRYPLR